MIEVPATFRAMPRWWAATPPEQQWLADLPQLVEARCERWNLTVDGRPLHGSNALVVPVLRGGRPAALRLAPPGDDVAADVGRTSDDVAERTPQLSEAWDRLGRPFDRGVLDVAADAASLILAGDREPVAVNTDLHFDQVLRHPDGRWCVVDPVLRRGDVERTAVEVLWHRVDEMADGEILAWLGVLVEAGELDAGLARAWALWRITDYLLWGLEHGLTQDPPRCARLLRALT